MCDNCQQFTHLHLHTDASPDGLGTVHRTVKAAKGLGFQSLGMTDHGTLANAISFTATCQQYGIKPIIGLEAYVGRDGKRFHLTILADGARGFRTLTELNNMGQRSDDTARPTFDLELLRKHNEGLIVLTGCPASPLQANDWADAYQIGLELKNALGSRLFAEVMFIASSDAPWERSAKLATDLRIAPIVTNDVHFALPQDHQAHSAVSQLRSGFTYDSRYLFLATPAQLRHRVKNMAPEHLELLEKGMKNAAFVASRLRVVEFDDKAKLPHIAGAEDTLRKLATNALASLEARSEHVRAQHQVYADRMAYELDVICSMGFASYFLILKDIVDFARSSGVRVGPGRGSGAGSLVLYLLGCTEVDPIRFGLSFDRFLNHKRAEMPDVDTDFESERRDRVLEYAKSRWGALAVATYLRWSHKSLVHDLSRYYRVPRSLDDAAADGGVESEPFKQIVNKYPGFAESYEAMLGQIKTVGQHAGGVTIVDSNYPVPLIRTTHGGLAAAWTEGEYRELSKAGIVKFDLLGLSALSVLRRLEEKHGRRAPEPVDDDPVFELFRTGDLLGIFQFAGSQGILDFTKKVAPRTFEDLVAINALYRPGALDSGAANHYTEWRQQPRKLHPLVDPILAPTYGIICYQEQFMQIFAKLTGGTMADADLARKVLAKARPGQPDWEAKMAELKVQFFEGAKRQAIDEAVAETIWSEIVTHTRYSFNRSHSVAYAMLAWEMAWWKFHYPIDFYAAMLSVDKVESQRYLFDVIAKGIQLVPPHVNRSTSEFESDGTKIYMPLSIVKNLGDAGIQAILDARPFKSVADFAARVPRRAVNARSLTGLWALGAFEGLEGTAKDLGIEEPPELSQEEVHAKYMGLLLPSRRLLEAIWAAKSMGQLAGIIVDRQKRKSNYGEYIVYKIMPEGTVWSREYTDLQIGDRVRLKVQWDNGKIRNVYPLIV